MRLIITSIFIFLRTSLISGETPLTHNPMIEHRIKINNHTFAVYEKKHDSAKEIIVLIHGKTISALPNFDLQVESGNVSVMDAFVQKGFQVYAMDMRGFGNTPRDASGWINPEKAFRDVVGLLEWVIQRHSHTIKPTLFGYSYGSLVSHFVVQKRPELVRELILYGHPIEHTYANRYNKIEGAVKSTAEEPIQEPNSVEWASSDFMENSTEQKVIDAYVSSTLNLDPILVDWNNLSEWTQLEPQKITVPTLLINGVHDPVAPIESLALFFGEIANPDRSWVIIPESGHAAHLEHSFAQMITSVIHFIRRSK